MMRLLLVLIGIFSWIQSNDAGQQMVFNHVTCERDYKKIGCFKKQDYFKDVLMMTNETTTDWNQFAEHLHNMACLCHQKAYRGGYKYFAIGDYSVCYGGKDVTAFTQMVTDRSQVSSECLSGNFYESCDNDEIECAGGVEDIYVYSFNTFVPTQPAPVDGRYSEWTEWTKCDRTCGKGHQKRERTCTNPLPSNKGRDCSVLGQSTEVQECNNDPCFIDWAKRDSSLYHFSRLMKTWNEAEEYCIQYGGHLASIGSQAENDFIKAEVKMRKLSGPFIGGTDAAKEKTWVWSDGSSMKYTNWRKNEPNNLNGEHCLVIYQTSPSWNDIRCDQKHHFVCKMNFYHENTYFFSTTKKTFDKAEEHCVSMNGHLTSILSATENDFLDREATERNMEYPWIGFEDREKEGQWKWTDGSNTNFIQWGQGEPNNLKQEHCAHLRFRKLNVWNDLKCDRELDYICKMSAPVGVYKTEQNLVPRGNAAYYFSNTKMTWSNAKENCVAIGGHLASVHSQDEYNFLLKEIEARKIEMPWLGGNDIGREGIWVWSDLTKMNFKTWRQGEPNNLGDEDCLSTIGTDSKWNDAKCHLNRNFICKIVYHNGNKYFISSDKKDFASADRHCVTLGGHLASVHSKEENDFLFNEWKKRGLKFTWIGFQDRDKEGQWKWTDGSEVNFKNWSQKEPNNLYNEDCTHIGFRNKNEWNDHKCKNKYNYICKF